MDEVILTIENLNSLDPNWTIIKDINLKVKKGEIFALIGESGSGKTTFVNLLAGIINDYSGKILFYDKNYTVKLLNKKIGFLYGASSLVEKLSVAENMSFVNFPCRKIFPFINWSSVNSLAEEALKKYGINDLNPRLKVFELSTEEKKIVEIIKIVLNTPDIIVLHEPTAGLSVDTIKKLYFIISEYKSGGGTVIYVTRQWEEALKIADRIAVLSNGQLVGTLMADKARKNPQNLMNLFLGNLDDSLDDNIGEEFEVIDSIFKAAEFLTSEYELNDILKFLAEHVTMTMNADSCIIRLIDEKTKVFIDQVSFKNNNNNIPDLKLEIIKKIIKSNKLFFATVRDVEFTSLFRGDTFGAKTVICAPVLIHSQLALIIQLFYNKIFIYSEREWKYLSTLTKQAAIAIEDTRLMGRSVLLKESHHRIKNNLQSIISLISIQKSYLRKNKKEYSLEDVLDDIISRIKSIAAVHDLLSKDEMGRSIINLKEIIQKVIGFAAYPNPDKKIDIELTLEDIFIPYNKATTIMLIINELVSNCYKHAFKGVDKGKIRIVCQKEEQIKIIVVDDGVGMPSDFDIKKNNNLGLSIVYSIIVNEFKGKIDFMALRKGTEVQVLLPI